MIWVLIGYMFLFIHRPFEVWPWLGTFHLERIYMVGALLFAAAYPGKCWLPNRQHLAYFAFAAAVIGCWLASPWLDAGEETVENFLKILVFYVLIVLTVHDEKSLRQLLLAFLAVMALYMSHSLREYFAGRHTYRMGIARMIGVDTSMGDPNSFGASIVYALPFVMPFWRCPSLSPPDAGGRYRGGRWLRGFLAGYVSLSVVCIALTGSRSAFVGLLLWGLLTVARSRWWLGSAVLAVGAAPILWAALPLSLQTRFETIIHPEVGPANAQESAQGRWEGLQIGLDLWSQNPVSGCGPGAWRPATGREIESHNLYGQLLGETGSLGAAAFAAILLGFWINLRQVRRAYLTRPEWGRDFLFQVSGAIGLAVVLLLFEGNFGHNLFRYSWLWFGGFLIITRYCVEQRLKGEEAYAGEATNWAPAAYDLGTTGYVA
jgi:hypothetical protein